MFRVLIFNIRKRGKKFNLQQTEFEFELMFHVITKGMTSHSQKTLLRPGKEFNPQETEFEEFLTFDDE